MSNSEWEKKATANAKNIKFAISNLSEHKGLIAEFSGGWDYDNFWKDVKKINKMFKSLDLKKDDREKLWTKLGKECDEVKARMEKEGKKKDRQSKKRKDMVLYILNRKIHYKIDAAKNISDWKEAKSALYDLQEWMKSGWDAANIQTQLLKELMGNEGHFSDEDWEECWNVWREEKLNLDRKYDEICDLNRSQFKREWMSPIGNNATTGDPYKAHKLIKRAQQVLHSGKAFKDATFEDFKSSLQKYWEKASYRIEEKKKEKENEWLSDMQSHVNRWQDNIRKQNNFINKLQNEINDLQEELHNAKTSEFANNVRNWIEEKQDKIIEASKNIEDFESKIEDVQKKINNH